MKRISEIKSFDEAINTVICGDARDLFNILPQDSIGLVIQDPPYGWVTKESWDNSSDIYSCFSEVQKGIKSVIKNTGSIYTWCGIGEKSHSLLVYFPILSDNFYFKDLITWKKRRGMGTKKGWLYTREEILWHVVDNKDFIWNKDKQYSEEPNQFKVGMSGYKCKSSFKRISNVWTDIPEVLSNKGIKHFTPKPLKALVRIMEAHAFENCVVLDPYAGSFSTAIAAEMLGLNWISCDIEEEYCQFGERRLEEWRNTLSM